MGLCPSKKFWRGMGEALEGLGRGISQVLARSLSVPFPFGPEKS